jgi:hypothetical protein
MKGCSWNKAEPLFAYPIYDHAKQSHTQYTLVLKVEEGMSAKGLFLVGDTSKLRQQLRIQYSLQTPHGNIDKN